MIYRKQNLIAKFRFPSRDIGRCKFPKPGKYAPSIGTAGDIWGKYKNISFPSPDISI